MKRINKAAAGFLLALGLVGNSFADDVFTYPPFDSTSSGEFMAGSGVSIKEKKELGVPIGTVTIWTKSTLPAGWLECNGQSVSTKYPELRKLMSTVPDYRGRYAQGASNNAEVGTTKEAGLPNIYGELGTFFGGGTCYGTSWGNYAFRAYKRSNDGTGGDNDQGIYNITFNAAWSNPIYGKSTTVQPPAVVVKYIIKAE